MRVARAGPPPPRTVAASARAPRPQPPQQEQGDDRGTTRAEEEPPAELQDARPIRLAIAASSCSRGDSFRRRRRPPGLPRRRGRPGRWRAAKVMRNTGARRRRSRRPGWATRRTRAVAPEQEHDQLIRTAPTPISTHAQAGEAAAVLDCSGTGARLSAATWTVADLLVTDVVLAGAVAVLVSVTVSVFAGAVIVFVSVVVIATAARASCSIP